MHIKYVVRSHGRLKRLQAQSLALLQRWGVPREDIYVFVADDEEAREYSEELGHRANVIAGQIGNVGSMEAVIKYFPEGERILMMDDDVRKLVHIEHGDREELSGARARKYFRGGFDLLAKRKMQIFGFYPNTQ